MPAEVVAVSPVDPDIPPAGEDIHLPGPSVQPILLAFGLTVALVGVTTFFPLVVAGVILSVVVVVRWIRDARRDIDHLPLEHH
jgi:Flp pilus assembly protein TadB